LVQAYIHCVSSVRVDHYLDGALIMYMIYDENKELMRTVARQEEAQQIVQQRDGWTFKCVRTPVVKPDLSMLEEAPF
jgi:hypothetical protein